MRRVIGLRVLEENLYTVLHGQGLHYCHVVHPQTVVLLRSREIGFHLQSPDVRVLLWVASPDSILDYSLVEN